MSTELGKLIGTKLSFQKNHASICRKMMAAFELDVMPVNATFKSALSNDMVTEQPELWSEVPFRNMHDPFCYELRVITIATRTSVKCYSPKPLPFFKVFLELTLSRILHAHMLQILFESSVQPNTYNFFLGQLI